MLCVVGGASGLNAHLQGEQIETEVALAMLAILAAFLAAKSATPLEPGVSFHLRDGWKEVPGTHTHGGVLSVTIALTLPEAAIKGMEEALFYLSDPASPGFGQPHWSLAELATKVRPLLCAMLNIRHRETTQSLTRTLEMARSMPLALTMPIAFSHP